jgi:hypothetical protein
VDGEQARVVVAANKRRAAPEPRIRRDRLYIVGLNEMDVQFIFVYRIHRSS